MYKKLTTFLFDKILLLLVFFFPLLIVLRSATINITVTIISIIMLFYIFKENHIELFKNKLISYLIIFFSFIFKSTFIVLNL